MSKAATNDEPITEIRIFKYHRIAKLKTPTWPPWFLMSRSKQRSINNKQKKLYLKTVSFQGISEELLSHYRAGKLVFIDKVIFDKLT